MRRRRSGFTLVEVLATLTLMAIVLPSIMRGITQSSLAADSARHRTEAAGLAQEEMAQILTAQTWQNGSQSGDFSPDWPAYSWDLASAPWAGDTIGAGLQELDLTVKWQERGRTKSITLSSMAYLRSQSTSSTTTQ